MSDFENKPFSEENTADTQLLPDEPSASPDNSDVPLWGAEPPESPRSFAQRHEGLIKKANGGRGTLLLICVLSLINMITLYANLNFSFPFGMTMPAVMALIGSDLASESGSNLLSVFLVVFAALMLLACFSMWQLSKKHTAPLGVFLGIFILDTLLLLGFIALFSINLADVIIDIAFHAWALFSIITLLRNRMRLNRLWRAEEAGETAPPYVPPTPRTKSSEGGGEEGWPQS